MSRIDSLRIKADYTGIEIGADETSEVIRNAELFIDTVTRVFELDESLTGKIYIEVPPGDSNKISEEVLETPIYGLKDDGFEPLSPEEIRSKARKNWLNLRRRTIESTKNIDQGRATESERAPSIEDTARSEPIDWRDNLQRKLNVRVRLNGS